MFNEKMYALGSKRSIIREIFEYCKSRANEIGADKVFDFSIGNPSVEPPIEISNAICDLVNNGNSVLLHGYTSAQGDLGVRTAIANEINEKFGAGVGPNNIYMTCGAAASLTISLRALLNEGEECVVFAPFFTEYRVFIENAQGRVVVSTPLEKTFQIDTVDLESKITEKTKAVIINSPNNPSGVVYSEETIKAVTDILKKKEKEFSHPIYLIADEPYRELVFGNVTVPYLMNYYDNTIVCYSYSKALSLPGERIGYVLVNPEISDFTSVYQAVAGAGRALGFVCAPSMLQKLIPHCLGKTSEIEIYDKNRMLLLEKLTEYGYTVVKPDGAFYLFVKALEEDAYKFYEKAKEKEILVVPCDDFGVSGYVRIAYCVDKMRIVNSLPAFRALAEEYGK